MNNQTTKIPLLNKDKRAGECLSIARDLDMVNPEAHKMETYGLPIKELERLTRSFHVLRHDKKAGEPLQAIDFKKAVIGVLVSCRMKSTRLPKKAILKIGDLTSVELCLHHCLTIENAHHVVLATSTVEQDDILEQHTYHDDVIFHRGAPRDMIDRFLTIAEPMGIDIIIRITADCPYVSNEIAQLNLTAHFEQGADYTSCPKAPIGTNAEVMNTTALKRLQEYFPEAEYSGYMTFFFMNNPTYFNLNIVEAPQELQRDYRLTLDYQVDLDFFNAIAAHFEQQQLPTTLPNIIQFLDEHPAIAAINSDQFVVYKSDPELIDTLNRVSTIDASIENKVE